MANDSFSMPELWKIFTVDGVTVLNVTLEYVTPSTVSVRLDSAVRDATTAIKLEVTTGKT